MSARVPVGALLLGLILAGVGCSGPRADGPDEPGAAARPALAEADDVEASPVDVAALAADLQQRIAQSREALAAMTAVQDDVLATTAHVAEAARVGAGLLAARPLEEPVAELVALADRADALALESRDLSEELQRVGALVDAYARWLEWRLQSGDVDPGVLADSSGQLARVDDPRARSDALADRAGNLSRALEEQRLAVQRALADGPPPGALLAEWIAGREAEADEAPGDDAASVAGGASVAAAAAPVVTAAPAEPWAGDEVVELVTTEGALVLELFDGLAPRHVTKFRRLVREGFYDGLTFHRIVPDHWLHGGCPLGTGAGGDGKRLRAEFSDVPFERGTVAMARMAHPASASTQFLIALRRLPELDGKYTIFGRVIRGNKVLDAIEALGNEEGLPTAEVVIERATLRPRGPDEPSRSLPER